MEPRKLNVFFSFLAYGGNGGTASEVPDLRHWFAETVLKIAKDNRVSELNFKTFSDTPVPMVRNLIVEAAKAAKADVLVMVDSDQKPDMYVGIDSTAKPFWDSSFSFLYDNWEKGPSVLLAPYCGPPPHPVYGGEENVYAFYWATKETVEGDDPLFGTTMYLEPYSRNESAANLGIQPCGAGPTGLSMWDMRAFDLVKRPYFYYEWDGEDMKCHHCRQPYPQNRCEKASTEDVTATRDISLNGTQKLGYNPLYMNWDSWAGHWKPRCVGKPKRITADQVGEKLAEAVRMKMRHGERIVQLGAGRFEAKGELVKVLGNGTAS